MKNPSSKYPLVYVEWHDAYANAEWLEPEEFQDWNDPDWFTVCEVGWLIAKHKTHYIVASRFNKGNEQFGLWQMIPKTWAKITVLQKPC